MCICMEYHSSTCNHQWLSLTEPCGYGMNLLNCSSRTTVQGIFAPGMCCPWCNGTAMDPFINQMLPLPAICAPPGACGPPAICAPSTCGPPAICGPAPACGMVANPCGTATPPCGMVEPCCVPSCCCKRCRRKGKANYNYKYSERSGDNCTVM